MHVSKISRTVSPHIGYTRPMQKVDGCSSKVLKKTPKMYTILFCERGLIFYPMEVAISKQLVMSSHSFFQPSTQ